MIVVISNGGRSRDIEKPTRSQKREARSYEPRSDGKKSTKLRSDG